MRHHISVATLAIILPCSLAAADNLLYSNGPMVTHPAGGPHGADFSVSAHPAARVGWQATLAYTGPENRLAEDFTVGAGGWTIERLRLFGVLGGSQYNPYAFPPESPFNGAHVNIWDGRPGDPGTNLIATSTDFIGTGWTGIYRINEHNPIMHMDIAFGGLALPPGTYWIDFQLSAAREVPYMPGTFTRTAATPYVMDATPAGIQTRLGNSRWLMNTTNWLPVEGNAAISPELPFEFHGDFSCHANCDGSTAEPILNVDDFTCFVNLFANQDPAANCDASTAAPVLNIDDFTCFINEFASGCP